MRSRKMRGKDFDVLDFFHKSSSSCSALPKTQWGSTRYINTHYCVSEFAG